MNKTDRPTLNLENRLIDFIIKPDFWVELNSFIATRLADYSTVSIRDIRHYKPLGNTKINGYQVYVLRGVY